MPSMVTLFRRGSVPADLHVLALALVALQGDAGHAPQRIGYVRVGQAGDHFRRQYVQDILCRALAVDRLGFAMGALPIHHHRRVGRRDLQLRLNVRRLSGRHRDLRAEGRESHIFHRDDILTRGQIDRTELTLAIGYGDSASRLQLDPRPL